MRRYFILLAIALIPFIGTAQMHEAFRGEPFIEVTGTAQQEIEPNEIYTIIRLKEFEENRQKIALEKLDAEFLAALKAAGIDRKRLELADAGSSIGKFGRKDKDAFRQKTYQLKLTSATELEKFLEKLEPVKVDLVDITRLHHSDYEKIKLELKVKALQAARTKAETLLKAVGSEVGKPLMVRDWEVESPQPMLETRVANFKQMDGMQEQADAGGSIAFRKIKLMAQITAQFGIK